MSNIYLAFIKEALQLTLLSQNTSIAEPPSGFARFLPSPAFPSLHPWEEADLDILSLVKMLNIHALHIRSQIAMGKIGIRTWVG